MSWLNAEAIENIEFIRVTSAVFQLPMSWLKEVACQNIHDIFVTFPVSHFEISRLNVLLQIFEYIYNKCSYIILQTNKLLIKKILI